MGKDKKEWKRELFACDEESWSKKVDRKLRMWRKLASGRGGGAGELGRDGTRGRDTDSAEAIQVAHWYLNASEPVLSLCLSRVPVWRVWVPD